MLLSHVSDLAWTIVFRYIISICGILFSKMTAEIPPMCPEA